MPLNILTSIHGNLIGLGANGELITNNPRTGLQNIKGNAKTTITSAQVLALNATPRTVVTAAGLGNILMVERWGVYKAAGTAYAGVAAGEDLVLKYTNGAGIQAATAIETTGFLDQATAQVRWANGLAGSAATPVADALPVNAPLVAQLLVGEITTGTSPLIVLVEYAIVPSVF